MRWLVYCLAALSVAACARPVPDVQGCAASESRQANWSSASAADTITASAEGPSCAQAVATLVVRNAAGDPLWAFASSYAAMKTGTPAFENADPVDEVEMRRFLAAWADVTLSTTGALPAWRENAPTLNESAQTFTYETPHDRGRYESLRAIDAPMLCYASTVETTQCLVIDPVTHAPAKMVSYGP